MGCELPDASPIVQGNRVTRRTRSIGDKDHGSTQAEDGGAEASDDAVDPAQQSGEQDIAAGQGSRYQHARGAVRTQVAAAQAEEGVMADWPSILAELQTMRGRLDQIAAAVVGERTREELMPVWDCGHRHASRGEALACKRKRDCQGEAA